jgi:parallel beta-helix repeat protein
MRRAICVLAAPVATVLVFVLCSGQALANHVQCGDVIRQNTTLDADLIGCPGTTLTVGADDITLNLDGHRIGDCCYPDTTGIVDDAHRGVVIENGRVLGVTGIRLVDAHETVMRDLDVFGPFAISMTRSTQNRLATSTIGTSYVAVSLDDSDHNAIQASTINGYYYGVNFEAGSDHNRVTDSTLSAERYGPAIHIENSGFNSIRRNQLRSSFTGIGLIDAEGNEVLANTSRVNDADVFLLRSDDNLIAGNEFIFSRDCKICLEDSDRNLIRANALASPFASEMAIRVAGSDNRIERNDASNNNAGIGVLSGARNSLTRNTANGSLGFYRFYSDGDGIFVTEQAASTVLTGNEANRNIADGIDVRDSTSRLIHNTANDNGDLGIEAVPGVVAVGNKAWGNGNPLQCLNVSCRSPNRRH